MNAKFSQKYTIVQFFEPIDAQYRYSSDAWPLHSTVVDTFKVDWPKSDLIAKLPDLFASLVSANSQALGDTRFGADGQTLVTLLERTPSLINLHLSTLSALEPGNLVLNDPEYAGSGFLPHATVQKHARLNRGDAVTFDTLSLVDMFPSGDPYTREVLLSLFLK